MTPGRKPSTRTSASAASRWRICWPAGCFRLIAMLCLLRLTNWKAARRASCEASPASAADASAGGVSIFNTSAPMSANIIVQKAPGATRISSRTFIPSSGPGIALPPYDGTRVDHSPHLHPLPLASVTLLLRESNARHTAGTLGYEHTIAPQESRRKSSV